MLPGNQIAGFFKMWYCKKEVNYEVYFLHVDKHWSLQQGDTIILGECNQACPKYSKKVWISLHYLHKSMRDKAEFFPAYKHKSFLKDGSITLGVISQTDQKQSIYDIFAISQGKYKGWSWFFLAADKCWRFFQIDTIVLGLCDQACPNYLK